MPNLSRDKEIVTKLKRSFKIKLNLKEDESGLFTGAGGIDSNSAAMPDSKLIYAAR